MSGTATVNIDTTIRHYEYAHTALLWTVWALLQVRGMSWDLPARHSCISW